MLVKEINKIAIFRALQLGDMLCAIPAIRALRAYLPHAHVTLIGLPWAMSFVERFSDHFDDFIAFPGYPGLPEQAFVASDIIPFLSDVQDQKFDLVLQMQGNGTLVNPLMELFGAKHTAGFKTPGHYAPDNGLYLNYPDQGSEIHRHIQLMEHLAIPHNGEELEFPLSYTDEQALSELDLGLEPGKYVCVHPGSRGSWRQWPPEYFAALANYCVEQGYTAVLTGTPDEMEIVNEVAQNMQNPPVIAAGKTSIGAVGVLIRDAALLISNCTGVSHMAAAFKTPSIVLSMDGEPERWGPLNKEIHHTFDWLANPDFHAVFRETVTMLTSLEQAAPPLPAQ